MEVAASLYDYSKDALRTPVTAQAGAGCTTGRIIDLGGTGWNTLKLAGTWRPAGATSFSPHVVDFGVQQDTAYLRTQVDNTADWLDGKALLPFSQFNGNTRLQSLYAQDTWRFATDRKTTLGLRFEHGSAYGGQLGNTGIAGRAVRMPTVSELHQGLILGTTIINTDPNLRPERSWTTELSAERDLRTWGVDGLLRTTLFFEWTSDALYNQVSPNGVTTVQNVDAIHTRGLEVALNAADVGFKGVDLGGSLTWADSEITANRGFAASVGHQPPRVPRARATLLATCRPNAQWSTTFGARYSGRQYGTLGNSDPNGATCTGFSKFFVTDVRVRCRIDKQ